MKKHKKCLVIGYINLNFGDDLFFDILFKRYPEVDFYLYPPSTLLKKYKSCLKKYKNVILYDKDKDYLKIREDITDEKVPINLFPLICKRAEKVDFYINIGGSIFMQNKNWKDDDRFILKNLLKNKKSFILGCNFGPGDKEYTDYFKNWFKEFDDVCFRDNKSYKIFEELSNVRKADDIVLINKSENKLNRKLYKKSIAISVINPEIRSSLQKYSADYYNWHSKVIKRYIDEGYNINLFSFCEEEGDLDAINKILKLIDKKYLKKIKVHNYQGNIKKYLSKYKKNKYVIGSRFHSIILALAYNQEFVALSYNYKIDNYLEDLNLNIKAIQISNLNKQTKKNLKFHSVNKKFASEKQFQKVDEYLNSESK